jgi:hypothetical protein
MTSDDADCAHEDSSGPSDGDSSSSPAPPLALEPQEGPLPPCRAVQGEDGADGAGGAGSAANERLQQRAAATEHLWRACKDADAEAAASALANRADPCAPDEVPSCPTSAASCPIGSACYPVPSALHRYL